MNKSLTELAADIVKAQVAHGALTESQIEELLQRIFRTLMKMKDTENGVTADTAVEAGSTPVAAPVADPKSSIKKDCVICLECGLEFKQLTHTHLKGHNLTPQEYRRKHGLPARQPLVAGVLSARRRETAKALRLAERLRAAKRKKTKTT